MSIGLSTFIRFTNLAIPLLVLANCAAFFSPNTATSNQSLATSIPTKCSLPFVIPSSCPYNRTVPALVFGLQDPPTVRAHQMRTRRPLLHDGLVRTCGRTVCRVLLYDTSGRLGVFAFFGVDASE